MKILLWLIPLGGLADTVTLKDGSFLRGRIERIADGVLELRMPTLGLSSELRISVEQIESFITDDEVAVSTGGKISKGIASASFGQVVTRGDVEVNSLNRKLELWRDPSLRPSDALATRQWVSQVDADISGRNGVVAGAGFSIGYTARGVTKANTMLGGIRYLRAESVGKVSADDLHATFSYEINPVNIVYWYMRTDTGFDNARQIDFFSVNAAGAGFRVFTDAKGKIDARLGFGHRYEVYKNGNQPRLTTPSGDLGLLVTRELGWAAWDSSINFVPSFNEDGDYLIRHESSMNVIRNLGPLSLRIGVANNFRSKPPPTQVKTDTAYFLRMVYIWK